MNLPLFAIRPEPGLSTTVEAARALGLEIEGEPLSQIRPIPWDAPDPSGFDGLLLGSANAVRHGGPGLARYRGKPALVVGDATAAEARAAGFEIGRTGTGGLQQLLDGLGGRRLRLLRIAGQDHVPLDLPPGIAVETRIAYANVPLALPGAFAERLRGGGVVLLHSAAAAGHFSLECERLAIRKEGLRLAALAARIAEAAGGGWDRVESAKEPREALLLAMARHMCH